jgi:hypothetical protein
MIELQKYRKKLAVGLFCFPVFLLKQRKLCEAVYSVNLQTTVLEFWSISFRYGLELTQVPQLEF